MHPNQNELDHIINIALLEDIGSGDITSNLTISENTQASFVIKSRQKLIVCGVDIAAYVFAKAKGSYKVATEINMQDGEVAGPGSILMTGHGDAKTIMAAERVALNLLRQMCGVATTTRDFVDAVAGTKVRILDTRKTIPGLRMLQKHAVNIGGGHNHRFGLYDGILIKDNHIAICGGIENALKISRLNAPHNLKIEIECDTVDQVKQALSAGADIILLDNMTIDQLKESVAITAGKIPLEASGNVSLGSVKEIAQTGVDFISVGSITNYPKSVDIGLDITT